MGGAVGREPWFPRVPTSTEEIAEDFARFVQFIDEEPEHPMARNRHVAPQARLLVPDRMEYSRIYGTREIPHLLSDLETHLRAQGWEGKLVLPNSNETPLRPLASFFTDPVRERIRRVYAEDFARFGYADDLPDGLDRSDRYSAEALGEVARLVDRAERINDVILRARTFQKAAAAAEERARELESRTVQRRARRFAGRARRRLERALPGR